MKYVVDVEGMTCDHCVKAVVTELSRVEGITDVGVALAPESSSIVSFSAGVEPSTESVQAAIAEAGYDMVGEVHTA